MTFTENLKNFKIFYIMLYILNSRVVKTALLKFTDKLKFNREDKEKYYIFNNVILNLDNYFNTFYSLKKFMG